ncbi:MAG: hypothetical protein ABWK05_08840 [Pyrobaculum sp.]
MGSEDPAEGHTPVKKQEVAAALIYALSMGGVAATLAVRTHPAAAAVPIGFSAAWPSHYLEKVAASRAPKMAQEDLPPKRLGGP